MSSFRRLCVLLALVLVTGCSVQANSVSVREPRIIGMPGSVGSGSAADADFERFIRDLNEQRQRRR